MKSVKLVFVAFACVLMTGCATSRGLEGESGNPVSDANRAFNHGDERLLVMNTIDYLVPGVAGDQKYLSNVRAKFGVRFLNATISDSQTYAAEFNRTMLSLKGCNLENPMAACQR